MKVTEFIRPNGRQVECDVEMSEEIDAMAAWVVSKGAQFQVEKLGIHNSVSIECAIPTNTGDVDSLAHEIVFLDAFAEDPRAQCNAVLEKVVRAAHTALKLQEAASTEFDIPSEILDDPRSTVT